MATKLRLVLGLCFFMSGVHLLNIFLDYRLSAYGIHPRDLSSIWTIVTAPFVHTSLAHLLNNLTGLVIFSLLSLVHSRRRYLLNSAFIILLSGFLVWLFGRPAPHVGASGWVFGLWSLCIASAWFERRLVNVLIALFVILFYGGLIYGVLPLDARVSFESHFFGAIAGFMCAYLNARGFFSKR